MDDIVVGLIACILSTVAFGVMLVPVKHYDTGDGMFVQWVMGSGIFSVGLLVEAVAKFSDEFYPLAMLSGALWAIGNVATVPIIHCIGMALCVLVGSSTNLFFGWVTGRFGFFGLFNEQIPKNEPLNYAALAVSAISAVIFLFVQSRPTKGRGHVPTTAKVTTIMPPNPPLSGGDYRDGDAAEHVDDATSTDAGNHVDNSCSRPCAVDEAPLVQNGRHDIEGQCAKKRVAAEHEFLPFLSANQKRVGGLFATLLAGALYGTCFAPVIFIQDHRNNTAFPQYMNASKEGLPYIFASYCGIFATTTLVFLIYCVAKRNRPYVRGELVLPAFATGVLWGVGQAAFFVANAKLSEAVTFPIISRLPGVICALLGVFYYREITGRRNLLILLLATTVTILGGVLSSLSIIL